MALGNSNRQFGFVEPPPALTPPSREPIWRDVVCTWLVEEETAAEATQRAMVVAGDLLILTDLSERPNMVRAVRVSSIRRVVLQEQPKRFCAASIRLVVQFFQSPEQAEAEAVGMSQHVDSPEPTMVLRPLVRGAAIDVNRIDGNPADTWELPRVLNYVRRALCGRNLPVQSVPEAADIRAARAPGERQPMFGPFERPPGFRSPLDKMQADEDYFARAVRRTDPDGASARDYSPLMVSAPSDAASVDPMVLCPPDVFEQMVPAPPVVLRKKLVDARVPGQALPSVAVKSVHLRLNVHRATAVHDAEAALEVDNVLPDNVDGVPPPPALIPPPHKLAENPAPKPPQPVARTGPRVVPAPAPRVQRTQTTRRAPPPPPPPPPPPRQPGAPPANAVYGSIDDCLRRARQPGAPRTPPADARAAAAEGAAVRRADGSHSDVPADTKDAEWWEEYAEGFVAAVRSGRRRHSVTESLDSEREDARRLREQVLAAEGRARRAEGQLRSVRASDASSSLCSGSSRGWRCTDRSSWSSCG